MTLAEIRSEAVAPRSSQVADVQCSGLRSTCIGELTHPPSSRRHCDVHCRAALRSTEPARSSTPLSVRSCAGTRHSWRAPRHTLDDLFQRVSAHPEVPFETFYPHHRDDARGRILSPNCSTRTVISDGPALFRPPGSR